MTVEIITFTAITNMYHRLNKVNPIPIVRESFYEKTSPPNFVVHIVKVRFKSFIWREKVMHDGYALERTMP